MGQKTITVCDGCGRDFASDELALALAGTITSRAGSFCGTAGESERPTDWHLKCLVERVGSPVPAKPPALPKPKGPREP